MTPIGSLADDERTHRAPPARRAGASRSGSTSGSSSTESTRAPAPRVNTRPLFERSTSSRVADQRRRLLSRRRPRSEQPSPSPRQRSRRSGVEQLAQPSRDECRSRASSISLSIAFAISFERLELVRPRVGRLVQPRVLDRDGGLRREQRDDLLVLVREVGAALLLGQVEVPVGDPAEQDRHAEERPHRRVAGREADRARILARCRAAAAGCGVADQDAEDPAAARQVADRRMRLGVDARGDEALELRARRIDDAERRVAGPGQLGSRLDQPLEQRLERQLGAERDAGFDETLEGRSPSREGTPRISAVTPQTHESGNSPMAGAAPRAYRPL